MLLRIALLAFRTGTIAGLLQGKGPPPGIVAFSLAAFNPKGYSRPAPSFP